MKSRAGSRASRMSTPRNWTRPSNSPATSASSGASSRHGSHHEPQKFTTTGVPRSLARMARYPAGSTRGRARGYVKPLATLGVETVADLLHHYPRRYIDRSKVTKMGDLRIGQEATVIGTVRRIRTQYTRRRQPIVTVTVFDGTGYLDLSWFNQSWPARRHREGQEVALSGRVSAFRGRPRVQNPAVEILGGTGADQVHTGRIVPVHPGGEGVSTAVIRRLVHEALRRVPQLADPIPEDVRHRRDLPPLHQAVRDIHFPETDEDQVRALERLKFDELFFPELGG